MYEYRVVLEREKDLVWEPRHQRAPNLVATPNNGEGEGIFEKRRNRMIDLCYELLAEASVPLLIPKSGFHDIRLCLWADAEAKTHLA
jgi:hypothetical protein